MAKAIKKQGSKRSKRRITQAGQQGKADLFDAQLRFDSLRALFENIKVHVVQAEDSASGAEAYTTAIEAIADMGIRKCEEAVSKMMEARPRVEGAEFGELIAIELATRIREGNQAAQDAEDCVADVLAILRGAKGPDALEGFRRQLRITLSSGKRDDDFFYPLDKAERGEDTAQWLSNLLRHELAKADDCDPLLRELRKWATGRDVELEAMTNALFAIMTRAIRQPRQIPSIKKLRAGG